MKYRDVEYNYQEWTTYRGEKASCWNCSDKSLLKNTDTVSFPTQTQDEMFKRIDDYIDNRSKHIELQELNNRACTEFYNNNPNLPKD
jgi:hypothetical protein